MPTSVLIAGATAAASAGASAGIGKLFGSKSGPKVSSAPPGINAGGLSSTFDNGTVSLGADANRRGLVGGLADTFGQQADALGGLLPTVAPGMSDLRRARLSEIDASRTAAIGNLRDNLSRRRVLGSSFAQDAAGRTELEFAKERDRVQAETFLQELELTTNLMQQAFTAERGKFQTHLDELNLEANLAAGLAGKATDVLGKNAQTEALLLAQSQQGAGKFFGQLAQPVGESVGKGLKGLNFGGGGATAVDLMPTSL